MQQKKNISPSGASDSQHLNTYPSLRWGIYLSVLRVLKKPSDSLLTIVITQFTVIPKWTAVTISPSNLLKPNCNNFNDPIF